jgi:hypothetical protein
VVDSRISFNFGWDIWFVKKIMAGQKIGRRREVDLLRRRELGDGVVVGGKKYD